MKALSRNFHLIILIGLFYGLLAGAVMYLAAELVPVMAAAALVLACLHLLNRFLHLDGLSDLGDGMVCGGNAERRVAAMKDSKTGAGGVGYVLTFELLSFAALSSITGRMELLFLPLIAEVMSKNAVVFCACGGKAREGLGNMFVANTGARHAAASLALSIALSVVMVLLLDLTTSAWTWQEAVIRVLAAALVSSLVGWCLSRVAERNFGAVNGDVLGATNEIGRPLVLLALLAVVGL